MPKPIIRTKATFQGVTQAGSNITVNTDMNLLKKPVVITVDTAFLSAAGDYKEEENGTYIVGGAINISETMIRMGLIFSRIASITIIVPEGIALVGGYPERRIANAIQTGSGLDGIPITIINSGILFGAGGTREGLINGQAAIYNSRSANDPIVVINKPTGWISGGGGAGEGAATKGNIYSGGGAPYGRGFGGGGDASLFYGGPENHRDGDNGGNVGRKGDGSRAGTAGAVYTGAVYMENSGRLGPV